VATDERSLRDGLNQAGANQISRRGFLTVSAAAAAAGMALPLLNACAPPAQPPAAPAGQQGAVKPVSGSGTTPASKAFPTYIPFTGGPKPDFSDPDPLFSTAFENFPAQTFKANQSPPGTGSVVNSLITAYFPLPTPFDLNPTWQAVNKALNADMKMNIIPGADYRVRFATTMSDNDLPDIMHVFFGYTVAPNLPAFFKSRCADLTPYLSGDAAKDYPYLAAIPTHSWRNSLSVVDGALYLIPIHRQMFSIQPRGGNFFTNIEMWDKEIGADVVPKSADDFKRILTQLNRPAENRWAIGNIGTNDSLFGLGGYSAMFGAPNNWKLDSSGKLIKDRETEEYKAAVGYVRDLFQGGLFHPDSPTFSRSRESFVGRKFAVSLEGQGNSWVDFWQQGQVLNPPTRFKMLTPWHAVEGQKPIQFLGTGFVSMNVLKKASPDRIKELLRILNFLASPFGSEEALLLSYGLKDQDYTLDEKGNPRPTPEGVARAGYVPWRYLSQHPWVTYQAGLTGFAKASYDAEKATIPIGIDDPTNGHYAATQYSKGNVADIAFNDGVRAIQLGQRPFTDYDSIVQEWRTAAGDQIRKEYMDAIAAAKA
jgi:putative aldouronate transport system substrate-binding protein